MEKHRISRIAKGEQRTSLLRASALLIGHSYVRALALEGRQTST